MKIKDVAELTGVTVRTLHYYDQIGLLSPKKLSENGYRIYEQQDLERLQQILFFRELEFPLREIKEIMENPNYEREAVLKKQWELLVYKRTKLDQLISSIQVALEQNLPISFHQFDRREFNRMKQEYQKEAKERWGNTPAYKEYEEKTASKDDAAKEKIDARGQAIMKEFSELVGQAPESEEVQNLVEKWQDYITENYYNCTKEILACLGQMYVQDERFQENIDQHGTGTAQLMADAIEIYCKS